MPHIPAGTLGVAADGRALSAVMRYCLGINVVPVLAQAGFADLFSVKHKAPWRPLPGSLPSSRRCSWFCREQRATPKRRRAPPYPPVTRPLRRAQSLYQAFLTRADMDRCCPRQMAVRKQKQVLSGEQARPSEACRCSGAFGATLPPCWPPLPESPSREPSLAPSLALSLDSPARSPSASPRSRSGFPRRAGVFRHEAGGRGVA